MTKIYTRTGDAGETSLLDGSRVLKSNLRVTAYGDVDELNAVLGAVRAFVQDDEINQMLEGIQRDLFAMGTQLADPKYAESRRPNKTALPPQRVEDLEQIIDRFQEELKPLKRFILPGGTQGAALLHVARTVCRRAERVAVALHAETPLDPVLLTYLNRLSDLLFVTARVVNRRSSEEDILW
ncbi:MAG: cob(I)yrinic acid a,c-diamide adenosyltransferase [Acidobacteria bacterium]|nr:cob(I)yrinic acid a,c-diamide adenosyltransferase [Acidobacteriota bacterium]